MANSAGAFGLEIAGQFAGYLTAAEGGEPVAPAVLEPPDANKVVRKHPGALVYTPIRLAFGGTMEKPLYQWMTDVLTRTQAAKNGAIVFYNYNLIEESRIEFSGALITEIVFPALDGSSNEAALFRLTLQPAATHVSFANAGVRGPAATNTVARRIMMRNFRLAIANLPTSRVARIEPIVVKQAVKREPSAIILQPLEISNLVFSVAQADAAAMYGWFDGFAATGASGAERNGTLELLNTSLTTVLFALAISNIGVSSVRRETETNGASVLTRIRVEAYVEQLTFAMLPLAAAPPASPPLLAPESIREALSTLSKEQGAHAADSGQAAFDPKAVARRMKAAASPAHSPSMHESGISVGSEWAAEHASLAELRQIAALTSRDWDAVRLEPNHSLVGHLVEAGVLQPNHEGPIDLARDGFTEGLIAGVSRVEQSVTPALEDDVSELAQRIQTYLSNAQDAEALASQVAKQAKDLVCMLKK